MLPAGYETTILAGERPQTQVIDSTVSGAGCVLSVRIVIFWRACTRVALWPSPSVQWSLTAGICTRLLQSKYQLSGTWKLVPNYGKCWLAQTVFDNWLIVIRLLCCVTVHGTVKERKPVYGPNHLSFSLRINLQILTTGLPLRNEPWCLTNCTARTEDTKRRIW